VPVAATDLGELYLLTPPAADPKAERERLDKEIAKLEKELEATARKLANSSFVDNAPREVVEEHRQRKVTFSDKLTQLRAARAALD
jgi:valyl-tRNA synthetase